MVRPGPVLALSALCVDQTLLGAYAQRYCKPQSEDPDWPSTASWLALNASVSGRLIRPVPAAAVCHVLWPQHNNSSCKYVAGQWANTSFHALSPTSVDYNDETCLPNPQAPCSNTGYPQYVIAAQSVTDVMQGVKFAAQTGIRLVVKATGHDYPGRSSGTESLSIYTHGIQGIEVVSHVDGDGLLAPIALVKIHAGHQFREIYRFALANNLTIIGGADPDVGIGGWILGGGHGPLSALYGMGADQIVEMEVITPHGEFRTINKDCHADLFWAMRGSGGSTFGVIISVTIRAYPPVPIAQVTLAYNTTADSDEFWSAATAFHSELPRLGNAGAMGYYQLNPRNSKEDNVSLAGQFGATLLIPGRSKEQAKEIMVPTTKAIRCSIKGDPIDVYIHTVEADNFLVWYFQNLGSKPEQGGVSSRLGSWMLDEKALHADTNHVKSALRTSTPAGELLVGHMVAGLGTHNPPNGIPGGSNAVGPAWRKAYTHIALPRFWTPLNDTEKHAVTDKLRDEEVEALRQLAPDVGAYVNEVDPTIPDWQQALYGSNYARLMEVKAKWDPEGVFWCKHCVGSELWHTVGDNGVENGVGQGSVKLCRRG